MSIENTLKEFIRTHKKMEILIERLKEEAKKEGSSKLQDIIINDNLENADDLLHMIKKFKKIKYSSNASEIITFTANMFNLEKDELYKASASYQEEEETISTSEMIQKTIEHFEEKGFIVRKENEEEIEITKENNMYYVTIDNDEMTEEEYVQVLERKKQLLSIGFVCFSEAKKREIITITKKWLQSHKERNTMLKIHVNTLFGIVENENPFEEIQ